MGQLKGILMAMVVAYATIAITTRVEPLKRIAGL